MPDLNTAEEAGVMDSWGARYWAAMKEYRGIRSEIRADLAEAVAAGDLDRADRLRRALGFLTRETRKLSNRP